MGAQPHWDPERPGRASLRKDPTRGMRNLPYLWLKAVAGDFDPPHHSLSCLLARGRYRVQLCAVGPLWPGPGTWVPQSIE